MAGAAFVPALYLPPAELVRQWISVDEIFVDNSENWIKQTLRNRTYILSANGVQCLSVPVVHTGGKPTRLKDIRISYSEPWVRVHKGALFSAYNTSPYFEFFREDLFQELEKRPVFLWDLNYALMRLILNKARYPGVLSVSEINSQHTDYKTYNNYRELKNEMPAVNPYAQVFSYKLPFTPYLSVIDMLSNLGRIV